MANSRSVRWKRRLTLTSVVKRTYKSSIGRHVEVLPYAPGFSFIRVAGIPMKTERRHELQTNALAARLTKWIEKTKEHSSGITMTVIIVGLVAGATFLFAQQSASRTEEAWEHLDMAPDTGFIGPPDLD